MIVGSMVHVGEIFHKEYKDKQTKEDKKMSLMPVAVYPNFPSKVGSWRMDVMPSEAQKKEQSQGRLLGFHIMLAKPKSETSYERERVTGISFDTAIFIQLMDARTGVNNYTSLQGGCSFQQAFQLFYDHLSSNEIDTIPDPEQYLANISANSANHGQPVNNVQPANHGQPVTKPVSDYPTRSAEVSVSSNKKPTSVFSS